MKNTIFYIIVFIQSVQLSYTQCPEDSYLRITSQSDIDDFVANFPNCHKIDTLAISNPDLKNLDFIHQIDSFDVLSITGVGVSNYDFMSDIKYIRKLILKDNDSLDQSIVIPYTYHIEELILENKVCSSIELLSSSAIDIDMYHKGDQPLEFTLSSEISHLLVFKVRGNVIINDTSPIDVNQGFGIMSNPNYTSFNDLHEIVDINDVLGLFISDLDYFSFEGIDKLESIFQIRLYDIDSISTISTNAATFNAILLDLDRIPNGMVDLTSFSQTPINTFNMIKVGLVKSLDGLNVSSLRSFNLQNNPNLEALFYNEDLEPKIDIGGIHIENNPKLNQCDAERVCEKLSSDFNPNSVSVFGNDEDCASVEAILEKCLTATEDYHNENQSISISPNPSLGKYSISMNLSSGETLSIQVLDFMGRVVRTPIYAQSFASGINSTEIDISELIQGTYIIVVSSDKKGILAKSMVIKQ